jgi:hypothetical protein
MDDMHRLFVNAEEVMRIELIELTEEWQLSFDANVPCINSEDQHPLIHCPVQIHYHTIALRPNIPSDVLVMFERMTKFCDKFEGDTLSEQCVPYVNTLYRLKARIRRDIFDFATLIKSTT